MSESILLLNPRRARKSRARKSRRRGRMPPALAAYWAARGRTHNPRKRRRPKRARRARARARTENPRRRARRSLRGSRRRGSLRRLARRRFRGAAQYGRGVLGEYVIPGTIGAAGALTMDVLWGYGSRYLPPTLQSGWAALGAKLGVVIGVAYAVNRFKPSLRSKVHTAAVGAATVALYGALKGVAQSVLGTKVPGLAGYMDYQSYALPGTRMGGYMPRAGGLGDLGDFFSPAAVIQPMGTAVPRQFGGYIAAQPMGGYMPQPHMRGGGGLMGYDWSSDGM